MTYPAHLRSYLNSDQPADRERAQAECAEYGLDYDAARRVIIREMVAEYEANEPARERRAGQTPNARQRGTQRATEGELGL